MNDAETPVGGREQAELERKVLEWLEKSGFPLELHVARAFREAGFAVEQNDYLSDPISGKLREVDCIAEMSRGVLLGATQEPQVVYSRIATLVECKSGGGGRPWVVLDSSPEFPDDDPLHDVLAEETMANDWGAVCPLAHESA